MPTNEDILAEFPVLKSMQIDFAHRQIVEAMDKARKQGAIDVLQGLKNQQVQIRKQQVRGKPVQHFLQTPFIDNLINNL